MRIVHLSDLHYRPADADLALASLRTVRETVERESVDLVVFAGDMFDRAIHNSAHDGLPRLLDAWQDILDLCPVVAVTGTPTHDVAGSYEPIQRLEAEHGFLVLEPDVAYVLAGGEIYLSGQEEDGTAELLILGCPEPSKEWWLADKTGLGREEAAQAVVDGMRGLLLGLGAIRREHASLPALMVYHGQVRGATLANGQSLRPGGVQIGRDDLALVGADYYALGDIHLAQRIGDLPAFYAGSAYPCNWGEVDQKQCWLVDLGVPVDYEVVGTEPFPRVTCVPFPHAPRRKIVQRVGAHLRNTEDMAGFQTWLALSGTQEERDLFDEEHLLELMTEAGALPGSRVTFEVIPTETVRAGEIQEAAGLTAKLAIYAENSNETPPPGTDEKAAQLESEARAAGSAPAGLHIRLDKLLLRGAIGIYKGQGVDDIELDLTGYDDGLIALVGPNGAGKTTLFDFMHPFVDKSRGGKLQDYFRLRDSYQDLYWTDSRTGDAYRAFIAVDGANASGACDYHLYRNGEPLVNGRKDDYETAIEGLFGSLPLYLRSAFVTQRASKKAPELSDATKGQRKDLFRELGGLEYLQAYADAAKGHRGELESALQRDAGEIEALERDVAAFVEPDLAGLRDALEVARRRITDVEARGKDARQAREAAQARLAVHAKAETELNGVRNQVVTLGHERGNLQQTIIALKTVQEQRPAIVKELAEYEALKAREEQHNAQRTTVLLERERLTTEHGRALEAHRTEQRKIESRQRELKDQAAALAREKDREMAEVDRLLALLHPVECPHCHKTFALGGETEQAAVETNQQRVLDLDIDAIMVERQAKAVAAELAALVAPPAPALPVFDDAPLRAVREELADYDIRGIRAALSQAETADAKIEAAGARIFTIEVQIKGLQGQAAALERRLDPGADKAVIDAQAAFDAVTREWQEAKAALVRLEAELASAEKAVADIERKRALLAETRERVATRRAEAAAWAYLERACGPDGIQALELDAMGPGIAAVANRILDAAYGSRFTIEFRTTRLGGKGAKVKQIEDFAIIVHDSERGGEQPIETLSGGEMVWVRKALFDAFAIVRDRSTGQRFLTAFIDEADGALDPEARAAYFRMIEAAHRESGRRHTIVVTHSEVAQQMIAQRIDMEALREANTADARV